MTEYTPSLSKLIKFFDENGTLTIRDINYLLDRVEELQSGWDQSYENLLVLNSVFVNRLHKDGDEIKALKSTCAKLEGYVNDLESQVWMLREYGIDGI